MHAYEVKFGLQISIYLIAKR